MNITATAQTRSALHLKTAEPNAVKIALALQQQPRLVKADSQFEVPKDILVLLKVAAGEMSEIQRVCEAYNTNPDNLVAAAKLYLQLCFASARGNDRRMLCLPNDANTDDIREHKKWLVKWLHPDRNHDKWESAIFIKVNDAFNRLQSAGTEMPLVAKPVVKVQKRPKAARSEQGFKKIDGKSLSRQAIKPVLFVVIIALLSYAALSFM